MLGGTWEWRHWLVAALVIAGCGLAGSLISWTCIATRVLGRVPAVIDASGVAEAATTWESMPTDLEDFHRALVADPAFQARTGEPRGDRAAIAACQALPIEARFAWTSDVQIRQREAKLYGHGLSHRLDRETSGVLLLARTPEADRRIKAQFEERKGVLKQYVAIAWGHPLGASGARLVLTLMIELQHRTGQFGLASMCIGVGQGLAVVIERT